MKWSNSWREIIEVVTNATALLGISGTRGEKIALQITGSLSLQADGSGSGRAIAPVLGSRHLVNFIPSPDSPFFTNKRATNKNNITEYTVIHKPLFLNAFQKMT